MRRVAILCAVLLLVVLAAPLALLALVDVDDYRGLLAEEVERRTGRAMRADGGLALSPSLSPTFSAGEVTLANAAWASRAHMLSVERVEVRVALLPLLAGRVEIRRLLLVRPQLALQTAADGRRSWDLERGEATGSGGGPRLALDVRSVEMRDLRVTHLDDASGVLRVLAVPALRISDAGERLDVALEGRYQDLPLRLAGTVDRVPRLLANQPYRLDLTLAAQGVEARVDGEVLRPAVAPEYAGRAALRVDDVALRSGLAGQGLPAGLGLEVTADAVGASATGLHVGALSAALGESRGSGSLGVSLGAARPSVQASLTFERLDLDQLLAGGRAPAPPSPRVFSEAPLDASLLRALDARVEVQARTLRLGGADVSDAAVTAVLDGGVLVADPVQAGVGGSRARGRLRVDAVPGGEGVGVALALEAAGVDLAALLGADAAGRVEGRADLAVDVSGRGASVAGIMGSLSGEARALVGEGRVRARTAEMMIGGVAALLSTMTTDDSDWSRLQCAAADFRVDSGVATANVLLVDTEHATVRGEGSVDLGRERLALLFTPAPKSVTLNVAVPVKVSGTFREPAYRPDELATARRVGSVALLVFPPAALASLGALAVYGASAAGAGLADADGPRHPCLVLAAGGAQPAPAAGTGEPSRTRKAAESVKRQLDRAADRIKGLFDR